MESFSLFTSPLLLISVIPVLLLIKKLWIQIFSKSNNLPPGPWKLPIIGNLHNLAGDNPHRRLTVLAKSYGPLLHLKLGEIDLITISSPDLAREILKTHDINFASRPQFLVGKIIFYNSSDIIFAPYGKYWWEILKICTTNLLSGKRVKSLGFIGEEEGNNLVEKIRAAAGFGDPVNLSRLFFSLANSAVARASFGKECGHQESFLMAMKDVSELGSGFGVADLFPSLSFVAGISGMGCRLRRTRRKIDEILDGIIEEHQRRGAGGDEIEEDLVDVLLRIKEDGSLDVPITIDNVKAVILDLFMAGTDTSSGFLAWVMAELIRHPEVMQKAQLEVRNSLQRTKVEENEINDLQYLNCVIHETLRLHPPVPLLVPRISKKSVKLLEYTIPAGSRVLINVGAIMKDPKYWDNPESFQPERFRGSSNTLDLKRANFEYLPFGSGRRICPGMTFALANVERWLAQLLFNFDWKMPDGKLPEELDMEEAFGGTVTRKNDLFLLATCRK